MSKIRKTDVNFHKKGIYDMHSEETKIQQDLPEGAFFKIEYPEKMIDNLEYDKCVEEATKNGFTKFSDVVNTKQRLIDTR